MASAPRPSTRSIALPHHSSISRLNARCRKPPWTKVALSGVRIAHTPGQSGSNPLHRAGMKPSISAASLFAESSPATRKASTVRAAMATLAVRGMFMPAEPRLDEFDRLDLVIALARRRRHLDLVADLAADQRPPERRVVADPSDPRVGFG